MNKPVCSELPHKEVRRVALFILTYSSPGFFQRFVSKSIHSISGKSELITPALRYNNLRTLLQTPNAGGFSSFFSSALTVKAKTGNAQWF